MAPRLIDGWFCDRSPGAGKVVFATPGAASTARRAGRIRGLGAGFDGMSTLPEPGDTIPAAGSGGVSPITGLTRAQIMLVFRNATGFDGNTFLTGVPTTHANSPNFSMSVWANFGVTGVFGFHPNPNQGVFVDFNDEPYSFSGVVGVPTVNTNSSLAVAPGLILPSTGDVPDYPGNAQSNWDAEGPQIDGFGGNIQVMDGSGNTIPVGGYGVVSYPSDGTTNAGWVHLMFSVRLDSGDGLFHTWIWLNDTEILSDYVSAEGRSGGLSFNNADYTAGGFGFDNDTGIFSAPTGGAYLQANNVGGHRRVVEYGYQQSPPGGEGLYGAVAEMWVAPGQFIDWSQQANRDKFQVTDEGPPKTYAPCDIGATGSRPTGTKPLLYLRGGPSSFPTNRAIAHSTLAVVGDDLVAIDDPPGP